MITKNGGKEFDRLPKTAETYRIIAGKNAVIINEKRTSVQCFGLFPFSETNRDILLLSANVITGECKTGT